MTDKLKIEFAPGCFDSFEGTQDELNELINEIKRLVDTGEIFEKSIPVDIEDLAEEDLDLISSFETTQIRILQ
jgi:hypothetical protein